MKLNTKITQIFLIIVVYCGFNTNTYPWGLYIPMESIADHGTGNAGGAVLIPDASINYSNPAGLVDFSNPQLVVAGAYVSSRFKFNGTMTNPGFGSPITQSGTSTTSPRGLIPRFIM